jgi:cytochrome b561
MTASKFVELGRRVIWPDRISAPALSSAILALTYAAGIGGLLQDSWPATNIGPRIDLHITFGLLLWLAVVARFAERRSQSCATQATGLREFRRHLSRSVYLLLYVLFGLDQLTFMAHAQFPRPAENLRDYLGYGLLALFTVHVLAALERRSDHQHHE